MPENPAGDVPLESCDDTRHAHALKQLATQGAVVLRGVVATKTVDAMREAFLARSGSQLDAGIHAESLAVGERRFMVASRFEPPFTDPAVYAATPILRIMRALLSDECVLGSFGCVVSLPGAPDQRNHRDFPGLFPEIGMDSMLPAYAITMIVPLINVDEETGTTLYWPGSHRQRVMSAKYPIAEAIWPKMDAGDCLLMDYRLVHSGSANRSRKPRPILYNVYCRPWFRDHVNYARLPRMLVSQSVLRGVPEEHRALFAP